MTLAHERSMVASHNLVSCAIPFLLPVTFALLFYILNAITMVMPGKVTSRYIPCKNLGDGSQDHADKELQVRMKKSRLTDLLNLLCVFR